MTSNDYIDSSVIGWSWDQHQEYKKWLNEIGEEWKIEVETTCKVASGIYFSEEGDIFIVRIKNKDSEEILTSYNINWSKIESRVQEGVWSYMEILIMFIQDSVYDYIQNHLLNDT